MLYAFTTNNTCGQCDSPIKDLEMKNNIKKDKIQDYWLPVTPPPEDYENFGQPKYVSANRDENG